MKRRVSFALAGALTLAGAGHAQSQRPDYPPPPETHAFEPIEPNPYFVQDPEDPRVLHKAPGADERGIDRGYIERMVRGSIPEETFDALERAGVPAPTGLPERPVIAPNASTFATVISGNILVIEGDESLVPNTQNGRMFDHNGSGLQRVVQQVWSRLRDNYDFITVFTTFNDAGVAAYYLPLQQDVTGLGECNFNSGDTFGCVFSQLPDGSKLQGFVFMNSLGYWDDWDWNYDGQTHDLSSFDASVYAVLGQEVGHRWGAGLRFVDPRTGATSKRLLGRDNSHWAAWVDTDASVMDGWDWSEPNDQGQYTLVDDMQRFSLLDLYAMGAVPVASPKPFFFIDNARFVPVPGLVGNQSIPGDAVLQVPSVSYMESQGITLRATGEKVDLTIQDIVNAEGVRCPDKDHTQKTFRQAVVLVTRPGQTAAQAAAEVARLETVLATWEEWWADRTGHALTLCTGIDVPCEHPVAELGAGHVDDEDGTVEAGQSFDLVLSARAADARVRNARARVRLLGNGAEAAKLEAAEIAVGELAPGESREVRVPVTLLDEYTCGYSMIVEVTLVSDNAETVREEYRLFPGYRELFAATFDEGDDGFRVNADGLDETTSGAFERTDVSLTCFMNPRTPERDASPGGKGAFLTANQGELSGTTSLWSGEIDVAGAVDPELRFAYWLEGQGGKLTVLVSRSGNGFTEAKVYDEPFHGWSLGRVVLKDVYPDDPPPEKLFVAFLLEGGGQVEGGIDEVRVLDPVGACMPPPGLCACHASGDSEVDGPGKLFGLAALFGLAGIFARRRRR